MGVRELGVETMKSWFRTAGSKDAERWTHHTHQMEKLDAVRLMWVGRRRHIRLNTITIEEIGSQMAR